MNPWGNSSYSENTPGISEGWINEGTKKQGKGDNWIKVATGSNFRVLKKKICWALVAIYVTEAWSQKIPMVSEI